jgi:ribosomal protein S18 acetylase RimI-like enzyme
MNLRKACTTDLKTLEELYSRCIDELNRRGIYQWNDKYPNRSTLSAAITSEDQYLLMDGETLIGAVVLNEEQAKEWATVKWRFTESIPLVIHGLVISPEAQGKGYGKQVLQTCEQYARTQGYNYIRLDVFPENPAAVGLYKKFGFQKRGEVIFAYKPEGHQEYHCYEKEL